MAESVGTVLRRAREQARLSLQDLSARTKIRVPLLEAIEREQFERLPEGLLMRGYLRAYAREVRLDPETIVRQYVAEFEPEPPAAEPPREEPQEIEWNPAPAARTAWAILAPAVPLILAAIFLVRMNESHESAPPAAGTPVATAVGTIGDERLGAGVADHRLTAAPAVEGLRLEIHPTALTWVEATADGTRVLFDLIDGSQRRVVEAEREIVMRVGDAAAFAYSINGTRGRALGNAGQVREIRITRDNIAEFLEP